MPTTPRTTPTGAKICHDIIGSRQIRWVSVQFEFHDQGAELRACWAADTKCGSFHFAVLSVWSPLGISYLTVPRLS